MSDRLDIVLFGATGFTGEHCISWLVQLSKIKNRNLTWGIAGRSEKKLRTVLDFYEGKFGYSLQNVSLIIADVEDEKSLHSMARQARIIVNCCGPFNLYGEAVVKACIEEGTHHVDVSAEVKYIEEMQLKYHQQAEEKGVYIISACGFESLPIDLVVVLLQEKFNGTLNSVEAYLHYQDAHNVTGTAVNYGLWESTLLDLAHEESDLSRQQLPDFKPKLQISWWPYKSGSVNAWALPFRLTERSVVGRTQRLFYEKEAKRPVQIETYVTVKKFFNIIVVLCFGSMVLIASKIANRLSICLNILLKFPAIFSLCFTSRQPPSEERIKKSHFSITLCGKGWKDKNTSPDHEFAEPPNRSIAARIQGSNPAYGVTCLCVVLSAIIVLTESDKMPSKGGVLPPGYAFAKTSLLQEIEENGVKFEILDEEKSKRK